MTYRQGDALLLLPRNKRRLGLYLHRSALCMIYAKDGPRYLLDVLKTKGASDVLRQSSAHTY